MAYAERRSENTYRLIASNGYDENGKNRRVTKTITLSDGITERQRTKELERQKILFQELVDSGNFLDGETITFKQFSEKWLKEYVNINLTPSTKKSYESKLEHRINPALGHIRMAKLQPIHIIQFINNLSEEDMRLDTHYKPFDKLLKLINDKEKPVSAKDIGLSPKTFIRMKNGEVINADTAKKTCEYLNVDLKKYFIKSGKSTKLSDKTIKAYYDLISSILTTAVEWNVVTQNVAERVKSPKVPKYKAKYYDDEQILQLLRLLESEPLIYKTIVYLTVDTGLRAGEIAGLEWSDINFEKNLITIGRQREYVHGEGVLVTKPKTETGFRELTFSPSVSALLKQYHEFQNKNKLDYCDLWYESDYVFTHPDGIPLHPHRPYKYFIEFLERNGLPKITFHGLRHSNASILIAEGVDIVTLSSRLGHADKNVTLNTYSHIIKAQEQKAANKMENLYSRIKLNDDDNSTQK